jgi:hypothetical protein
MSTVSVAGYSTAERVGEVLKRAVPLLAPEARREVEKLLDPDTLLVVAGVLTAWIASHSFGLGEIIDAIVVGLGVVAIGLSIFEGLDELYLFGKLAINAQSSQDFDDSAKHFARAVSVLGVQAVLAFLFKGTPKTFKGGRFDMGPAPAFATGVRSRPPLVATRRLAAGAGETDFWGGIVISRLGTAADRRLAAMHESIHRMLAPKLAVLRRFRVGGRAASYNRSSLAVYLEEALAETAAQVGVNGIGAAFRGVTFPVKFGYVTLLREATVRGQRVRPFLPELGGLTAGGFIYGGVAYEIWWSPTQPKTVDEPK